MKLSKEIIKKIEKDPLYSCEDFINEANLYINSAKKRTLFCIKYDTNNKSDRISFKGYTKFKGGGYYHGFYNLLLFMGFSPSRKGGFIISGKNLCPVFATHREIMWRLKNMGFIRENTFQKIIRKSIQKF